MERKNSEDLFKGIISILLITAPALIFGAYEMTTQMGLSIVAGSLGAGFLNIDRIQRLKGAGFEAEMRKAVEEAYATTESLKSIAKPLLLTTIDILTMGGRIGGMNPHDKHNYHYELNCIASSLGFAQNKDFLDAQSKFYRYHTWDHYRYYVGALRKVKDFDQTITNELYELCDFSNTIFPSEDQIRSLIFPSSDKLCEHHDELLKDYLYYKEEHKLRRPEALEDR